MMVCGTMFAVFIIANSPTCVFDAPVPRVEARRVPGIVVERRVPPGVRRPLDIRPPLPPMRKPQDFYWTAKP